MTDRMTMDGTQAHERAICGDLAADESLVGEVSQEAIIVGVLTTAYTTGAEAYEGDYEVTPTVEGLALPTKHKYMTDDVTVRAIPFFEVSNTGGGTTVYIADEIEME